MGARRSGERTPRRAALVIAVALAATVAVLGAVGCGDSSPAIVPSTSPTRPFAPVARFSEPQVTIPAHELVAAIPHSFFGFSTEYWTLPVDELHAELYRRVISYLHVPGDGPFVLRIGGDSSDHTFYDPRYGPLPRWAFDLTPQFVDRTALIVRALRLRVILDMNLITGSPELASAWAHFAEAQMPHRSIIGFEIGNEPDLYDYAFWLSVTQGVRIATDALPRDISPGDYAKDYDAYARVLGQVEPGVPLYAPALASPGTDHSFISALLATPHPGLRVISGHRYPYSGCTDRDSPAYPTIGRLLSEAATVGMAQSLKPALLIAHHAGYPFELTEFNSITCGGLAGVSNAFATALWVPDAEFELFRAGIRGIHLHARQHAINDPFTFDTTGMTARPLLYGLILFARTLGPNARFVPLHLRSEAALHLKVWAVEVGRDRLHVLLINKGPNRLRVGLNLPARGAGTVERLLAPAPDAFSGETLGGRWLGRDAHWHGRPVRERVRGRGHRYTVTMPAYSAALLSVHLVRGSLG